MLTLQAQSMLPVPFSHHGIKVVNDNARSHTDAESFRLKASSRQIRGLQRSVSLRGVTQQCRWQSTPTLVDSESSMPLNRRALFTRSLSLNDVPKDITMPVRVVKDSLRRIPDSSITASSSSIVETTLASNIAIQQVSHEGHYLTTAKSSNLLCGELSPQRERISLRKPVRKLSPKPTATEVVPAFLRCSMRTLPHQHGQGLMKKRVHESPMFPLSGHLSPKRSIRFDTLAIQFLSDKLLLAEPDAPNIRTRDALTAALNQTGGIPKSSTIGALCLPEESPPLP